MPLARLSASHRSNWELLTEGFRMMGPAFLVSVSHVDPGDWATAIEGGSRFGMKLVWVVVLSHFIAIHLQNLAARLGLATGKHLAQVCRQHYPRLVCYLLWFLCEVSIVALDLTMVLGTALGLSLLLRVPVLPCILVSGLDTLVLVLLPQLGMRKAEKLTVGLMALIVLCFLVEIFIVKPPLRAVIGGLYPSLGRDSLYTAVSLLGANVMPHNFYLHSALVTSQAQQGRSTSLLFRYNFIDISVALGIALLINVAVIVVASETFHAHGIIVLTLQDAHNMMEQILSSSTAPAAFGLALLCAGQLSTFTGTISGQVVLQGFLNVRMATWKRRLITRTAAVTPAALLQYAYGDQGTYQLLVMMQVVLALALPFTLVPLIKATSSKQLMGSFRNSPAIGLLSWAACSLIFSANLLLLLHWLFPDEDEEGDLLDMALSLASEKPLLLVGLVGSVVLASAALALLVWMICTPFGGEFHDELAQEKPAKILLEQLVEADVELASGGDLQQGEARLRSGPGKQPEALKPTASTEMLLQGQPPGEVKRSEAESKADGDQGLAVQQQQPDLAAHQRQPDLAAHQQELDEDDWESRADDLLSRDIFDIRRDLHLPALVATLAEPPPLAGSAGWGQSLPGPERTAERAPGQAGAAHQDATSSARDVPHAMSQGVRRELAQLLADFWSRFYDLHGNTLASHSLAGPLVSFPASRLLVSQPLWAGQAPGETLLSVREVLCQIGCLSGGGSLFSGHLSGQLALAERTIAQVWSSAPAASKPTASPSQQWHNPAADAADGSELLDCQILVTFGLWCLARLLELCQQEPRPELWGRYALGLNRLQGIVRQLQGACDAETVGSLQQLIKAAEQAVTQRKGPPGTSAGNVAFPKGKEVILSTLKRLRRALSDPAPRSLASTPNKRFRAGSAGRFIATLALFGCFFVVATQRGTLLFQSAQLQ